MVVVYVRTMVVVHVHYPTMPVLHVINALLVCTARAFCRMRVYLIPNKTTKPTIIGYYGSSCAACPGGGGTLACGQSINAGTCSSGRNGTGICSCNTGFNGFDCQQPNIISASPNKASTIGGTQITLTGKSFGPIPTVTSIGTSSNITWGVAQKNDIRIVTQVESSPTGNSVRLMVTNPFVDPPRQSDIHFLFQYENPNIISLSSTVGYSDTPITLTGKHVQSPSHLLE
jgi:hypothetical protein